MFHPEKEEQSSSPAGQTIKRSLWSLNSGKREKAQCNVPISISFKPTKSLSVFKHPLPSTSPFKSAYLDPPVSITFI